MLVMFGVGLGSLTLMLVLGGLTAAAVAVSGLIAFVGIIMAAGTLFVLDASLPGGMIAGSGIEVREVRGVRSSAAAW